MKNGILTLIFSCIPGAGQMYQGYMKRGLSLVSMFCLTILFGMLLPPLSITCLIVWMYSFFDTFNLRAEIAAGTAQPDDYLVHVDLYDRRMRQMLSESHKLLGWALILTGVLVAYQQVVMRIMNELMWNGGRNSVAFRAVYMMMDQLPQVLVCVVLILCGVWLVRGPRSARTAASQTPEEDFCNYAAPSAQPAPPQDPAEDPAEQEALRIIQAAMQPQTQEDEDHERDDIDDFFHEQDDTEPDGQ